MVRQLPKQMVQLLATRYTENTVAQYSSWFMEGFLDDYFVDSIFIKVGDLICGRH